MANIGNLVVRLGLDISGLERGLARAQKTLRSAGRELQQIGAGLTFGLSAPLAGVATVALKSAAEFETSMNMIQAVSGATASQMAALSEQALQLGAQTAFSAGEAAQGMLELAKAGLTVEQTQAAIAGTMALAAAGGLDLARAAEITANSLNAYKLSATEAAIISDVLAAAANSSSVDVVDLADALKMAGTVAAQNGVSFQDTATALAILGNNALKGSDAGTSLKTMLMRLTAPTDAAAAAMQSLGIAIYNADGSMRSFPEIINNLQSSLSGLSDEQRNAAMATIFGADAIRAASILVDNAGSSWDAMSAAVNRSGAAGELADARMKGLGGAIEYFRGSIDSLLISSATPFLDTMANMVRGAADLLTSITQLPPEIQRFGAVMLMAVAAAGPLLTIVGTMTTALAGLLSPIGLVIAGAVLLGVAFATNFGGIRDATMALVAAVQPAVQSMIDWFSAQIPMALAAGQTAWSNMSAAVSAAWQSVMALLEPAFVRIGAAFAEMPSQLAPLQTAFGEFVTAVGGAVEALQPVLVGIGTLIAGVFGVTAVTALNTFASVLNAAIPAVTVILEQLTVMINLVATTVSNMVTLVVALINGDWQTAFESARNIGQAFADAFIQTLNNLAELVMLVMVAISSAIVSTLTQLGVDIPALLGKIAAVWNSVWSALQAPIDAVIGGIANFRSALDGLIGWLGGLSIPNPFAGWEMPELPGGFEFPSIPNPFGRNALGTPAWPGGWTLVGERGPELVNLRGGAAIEPLGALSGGNVIIEAVHIHNDMDVEELAYRVFQIRNRRVTR